MERKEYVWYPAEDPDEWRLLQLLSRTPGVGASLRLNQKDILISSDDLRLIFPKLEAAPQDLAQLVPWRVDTLKACKLRRRMDWGTPRSRCLGPADVPRCLS